MDSDTEDYNLVFSEDSESEADVDLKNHYFYGKSLKTECMEDSLKCFETVLMLQDGVKTIWGCKSLKQMIKINFSLKRLDEATLHYKQLFSYLKVVTRNYREKSIDSIMNYVSKYTNAKFLQELCEITLQVVKEDKNKRLWFKTNLRLGWVYFDTRDFRNVSKIIKEVRKVSALSSESDENQIKRLLLEVKVLEMQMCMEQKQLTKVKTLYEELMDAEFVSTNSDINAVIKECGGKMYLKQHNYVKARQHFFAAFKNYSFTDNYRRIICLKYMLLINMMTYLAVDPFEAPEAKPYEDLPELVALKNLFHAHGTDDIKLFSKVLQENRQNIMNDSLIKEYIEELWDDMKARTAVALVSSYSRIRIPYIATELCVTSAEAEDILVKCILDRCILGKIDQVNQILIVYRKDDSAKYQALTNWHNCVGCSLQNATDNFT